MAEQDPELDAAMATPVGRAFNRLFNDPEFAGQVADNPEAALAEYALDTDDAEAILTDAEALEGEVSGFARMKNAADLMNVLGGMRTPSRLGTTATRLHYWCLTCV